MVAALVVAHFVGQHLHRFLGRRAQGQGDVGPENAHQTGAGQGVGKINGNGAHVPLAAQKLAQSGKYDAVICLGAVIRGSTSHYDLVCNEAAKGIAQVNLQTGVPVTFGVVTTENIEQAIERAGTKAGNKGADAAIAALELANLLPQL